MVQTLGFVYSDQFQEYDFGPTHPLRPTRLKLTYELMKAIGLLDAANVKTVPPRPATKDDLLLFHEEAYVQLVEKMSARGSGFLDMGDTPVFKGCYEASALATGASLSAVDLVMSGKATYAMNIAGGLHHAHPNRASGFCIFNDPAISIAYLKKRYGLDRILYLDVDAHHGDGVMYGFYSDSAVLDIDFHESGHHLFPGTGFTEEIGEGKAEGLKINIPLPPFTGDDKYLALFREIVPRAVRNYRPQMLLLQCGADSHANDLLAHLQITTETYQEVVTTVRDLAGEVAEGRLVVFGGGGYDLANVARAWTVAACTLARFEPPMATPAEWRKMFEALVGEQAPEILRSEGEARRELSGRASFDVERTLKDLRSRIPLIA